MLALHQKHLLHRLPLVLLVLATATAASPQLTDADITRILITQSLQNYPGNCPCPYFTDRAGRSCGRRSAYTRPGGYAPLCYPSDITPEMIKSYRTSHPNPPTSRNH